LVRFGYFKIIIDIDSATSALYDALHFCVTRFVPLVVFKPSKFPSWFSNDLKNIVFAKKKMHAKYKLSLNPVDYKSITSSLTCVLSINITVKDAIKRFWIALKTCLNLILVYFGTLCVSKGLPMVFPMLSTSMINEGPQILNPSPVFSRLT